VGERRSVRTVAQEQQSDSCGRCVKQKGKNNPNPFQEEKRREEKRREEKRRDKSLKAEFR
jgi:hypothetical protein